MVPFFHRRPAGKMDEWWAPEWYRIALRSCMVPNIQLELGGKCEKEVEGTCCGYYVSVVYEGKDGGNVLV